MVELDEHSLRLDTALLFDEVAVPGHHRGAHGSPARSTTAWPRRSPRSATSSTTSLPRRPADGPRAAARPPRRDHPRRRELRLSIFDLRSEISRPPGSAPRSSDYVRTVGAQSGPDRAPDPRRVPDPAAQRGRDRAAADHAGSDHQRPQALPAENLWVDCRVAPAAAPRSTVSDDGAGLGTGRATTPTACGSCGSAPTGIGAQLSTIASRTRRRHRAGRR